MRKEMVLLVATTVLVTIAGCSDNTAMEGDTPKSAGTEVQSEVIEQAKNTEISIGTEDVETTEDIIDSSEVENATEQDVGTEGWEPGEVQFIGEWDDNMIYTHVDIWLNEKVCDFVNASWYWNFVDAELYHDITLENVVSADGMIANDGDMVPVGFEGVHTEGNFSYTLTNFYNHEVSLEECSITALSWDEDSPIHAYDSSMAPAGITLEELQEKVHAEETELDGEKAAMIPCGIDKTLYYVFDSNGLVYRWVVK